VAKNNKIGDLVALWPVELKDPIVGIVIQKRADGCYFVFACNRVYRFVEQICLFNLDDKPDVYYDCTSRGVLSRQIGFEIEMMIMGDLFEYAKKN
jgi:hypothetical protein